MDRIMVKEGGQEKRKESVKEGGQKQWMEKWGESLKKGEE